jgi:hypothetical protein
MLGKIRPVYRHEFPEGGHGFQIGRQHGVLKTGLTAEIELR